MHVTSSRSNLVFILAHWLLVLLILLLLVSGVYLESISTAAPERNSFLQVHYSLGLTSLTVIVLLALLRLASTSPAVTGKYAGWLGHLNSTSYAVIYICLLLIPLSGYLQAIFSKAAVRFWGLPLPAWELSNSALAEFFWTIHGAVACVLVLFIIVHVALVALGTKDGPTAHGTGGVSGRGYLIEATPPAVRKIAQKLSRNFRLYGWLAFWLQLGLAFASDLLLVLATSGRTFSPGGTPLEDGMSWATWAYYIVWLTIFMAFFYTRAAEKIVLSPDIYINSEKEFGFWFLGSGILAGIAGFLASLGGVAASISLMVAKTVSQPTGSAMTDPDTIVRAPDVFVLLVNIILLIAHSIGTAISVWLGFRAGSSRMEFHRMSLSGGANPEPSRIETV